MTIEDIIVQAHACIITLNSGCTECDAKAKDFYKSVIKSMEVLNILCMHMEIKESDANLDTYSIYSSPLFDSEYREIMEWFDENPDKERKNKNVKMEG